MTEEEKKDEMPQDEATEQVVENDLERFEREASEYKDKYLRNLAELENSRKRLQKERQDIGRFAMQNLVLDLLHPLDHLEKALASTEHMSDEVRNWAYGFEMILNQLKEALAGHGIAPFHTKGEQFDPHHHEAIEMVETNDIAEGTIVEELLCGWRMGERTLRPARVKVAKKMNEEFEDKTTNTTEEK